MEGSGRKPYPTEERVLTTEEMSEALINALITTTPPHELTHPTVRDRRTALKGAVRKHLSGQAVTVQHHKVGLRLKPC